MTGEEQLKACENLAKSIIAAIEATRQDKAKLKKARDKANRERKTRETPKKDKDG